MKDYLTECFLCKEDYTDPRSLPCIHTFCLECLESYRSANPSAAGKTMLCPFCRKEFQIPENGISGLKKNFFVERLVKVKAIASSKLKDRMCDECFDNCELTDVAVQWAVQCCFQCDQFLCRTCSRIHRGKELNKNHSLIDLGTDSLHVYELLKTNNSVTIPCDKHSEEHVQMVCTDCQVFACVTCIDEDHQQHTIRSIKRVADDYQNQLLQLIDEVTSCATGTEKKEQTLLKEMADFQRNADDCKKEIVGAIEDLKRLVDAQGKTLIDQLFRTKQRQLKLLQNEVDELQTHRDLLDHFKNYCSEMKTKSTKSDLCDSFSDLSRRAKELQNIHDSDIHALTCFVRVLFAKTQSIDPKNYNIVGKLKETVEVFFMQREIGDQFTEDSAIDTVLDVEHNHILEPFLRDLKATCGKQHETVYTPVKVAEATVKLSEGSVAPYEPISNKTQSPMEQNQSAIGTDALDLEPLTENSGSDLDLASSHISEFPNESPSDGYGTKRTFERTDICGELTFDEPTNVDLINEAANILSTTSFTSDCVPLAQNELKQGCFNRNVIEETVEDMTVQNSFGGTSNSNLAGYLCLGDSVAHPISSTLGTCPERLDNINPLDKLLENIHFPDISVTNAFCDELIPDSVSDSRCQTFCSGNYFPEVSQNSFKTLENSVVKQNKGANMARLLCRKKRIQELGRRHARGGKQMNIKAWFTQTSKKPRGELDNLKKTELSTDDELPDLTIGETEESLSSQPVTSEEDVESVHEGTTSCQPCSYDFPLGRYVNATSDIGLGLVTRQISKAEPSSLADRTLTTSNIQIQPDDSTQCSKKRKRATSETTQTDRSKRCRPKGARSLELVHKLKTGSPEVYGVTSLENKIYVLRKKSVSIYCTEDPKQLLNNIKLQDVISPFDICACKKSASIYITDFGKYHEDDEKRCIWKITVSEQRVYRWYCGIGEPYTLSVNSAGNVILLRIEALEILSDKAELIRRICLPSEIEEPEHAMETSIGSFVICHKRHEYDIWTVSEVNGNGVIVRRLQGTELLSEPKHLALDADDGVFVADWGNNRVAILGAQFNWDQIVFAKKQDDKDGLVNPTRLCYVAEKKQLIVVSNSLKVCVYRFMRP